MQPYKYGTSIFFSFGLNHKSPLAILNSVLYLIPHLGMYGKASIDPGIVLPFFRGAR